MPDDIPEIKVKKETPLVDVLLDQGLVSSKSDARRMIEQGGVKKDDTVIDSVDAKAEAGTYRVGKRKFLRIV